MQQTNFKFEILIHDDASTDGTAVIIRTYEKKYPNIIKPIYQNVNQYSQGINPDFTYNYPRAKGKYLAICEGDDYWTDPLKLQKQVDFLEANPEYGICHTKYTKLDEKSNKFKTHELERVCDDDFQNYIETGDMRTMTVMFRVLYIDPIGKLFKEPFMLDAPIGDRPIFLLISSHSKIYYLNEVTGVYRLSTNTSASRFKEHVKYYEFLKKVLNLNRNLYDYLKISVNKRYIYKYRRNKRFYEMLIQYFNKNWNTFFLLFFKKTILFEWNKKHFIEFLGVIKK
jgi:glycosyltransferase involved in cell wall biosynthesis